MRRLAAVEQGRAVCHPTPGETGQRSMALDLLVALGKDHDALAIERLSPKAWPLARTWVAAEQIRDLLVLRAHLLPGARWADLLSLQGAPGMRLWLIVHQGAPTAAQRRTLNNSAGEVELAQFSDHWASAVDGSAGAEARPVLPSEDFLVFRAACRRHLAQEHFDYVDEQYRRSLDETATWLRAWPEATPLSRPAVHAFLQRLTADCGDAADALVRFRALQSELFRHGWLLSARGQEVAAFDPTTAVARLDQHRATRLRAVAEPRATALAMASLVSEAALDAILRMKVGDVSPGAIVVNDHIHLIPTWADGLVAALIHERRQSGAVAHDPLFVDRRGRGPMQAREAGQLLSQVGRRTGIRFRLPSLYAKWAPPSSWLSVDALRLVEIGDPPERVTPWLLYD